jgi:hypothetical protein
MTRDTFKAKGDDPRGLSKSPAPTIFPGEIRPANALELIAIGVALNARYPNDDYILGRIKYLTCDEIMVREDYISDGPGFCGKLAVIFWGEPQFLTIIGDNGSTDTNWEVIEVEI